MTDEPPERPLSRRVDEPPSLEASKVRQVRARDLGYRFLAGAVTSIIAGALTLEISPRVGGTMLAFPAILVASLTLIAEKEDRDKAREDARGAILGGCALAAFAGVCAVGFGQWNPAIVLTGATGAWAAVALGGYVLAWFRSSRR